MSLLRILLAGSLTVVACGQSESTLGSGNDSGGSEAAAGAGPLDGAGTGAVGEDFDGGAPAAPAVSGGRPSTGGGKSVTGGRASTGAGGGSTGVAGSGGAAMMNPGGRGGASPTFGGMTAAGGRGMAVCALSPDAVVVTPEEYDVPDDIWESPESCRARDPELQMNAELLLKAEPVSVAPLAGTWTDGEGDARIELVLDERGEGTLLFGEATELPEIEDPDASYLLDTGPDDWSDVFGSTGGVRTGFRYRVVPKNGRASEMQFAVFLSEPWGDWCAAQAPVRGQNCFACELLLSSTSFAGEECGERRGCFQQQFEISSTTLVKSDCGRLALCTNMCECTSETCGSSPSFSNWYRVTIDPVDVSVLRFGRDGSMPERYLVRE